ncbi:MAG: (2Fe-2S)-binding protein [Ethanoligenens sp.]
MIEQTGFLDYTELKERQTLPNDDRCRKGPVAVIECVQEIPCNPCETSCPHQAITVGEPIVNLPALNEEKCVGCCICVAKCPGQAIFVVDKSLGEYAAVSFPYEYFPLPGKGDTVKAVNRQGQIVCDAIVKNVLNPRSYDHTPVITIEIPQAYADEVRSILRLPEKTDSLSDDMLVCRCEEVTVGEIRQAIREGARDVTGVKRRTRAGMGLCQGRTCEKLVQQILCKELGMPADSVGYASARPPVRPISFGDLAGGTVE